jgi:hypothetical protein
MTYFSLEWEFLQTKAVEKIKTHILCSKAFYENRAICEKMWKNIVEPDRPQTEMWYMHISSWIPKATDTYL